MSSFNDDFVNDINKNRSHLQKLFGVLTKSTYKNKQWPGYIPDQVEIDLEDDYYASDFTINKYIESSDEKHNNREYITSGTFGGTCEIRNKNKSRGVLGNLTYPFKKVFYTDTRPPPEKIENIRYNIIPLKQSKADENIKYFATIDYTFELLKEHNYDSELIKQNLQHLINKDNNDIDDILLILRVNDIRDAKDIINAIHIIQWLEFMEKYDSIPNNGEKINNDMDMDIDNNTTPSIITEPQDEDITMSDNEEFVKLTKEQLDEMVSIKQAKILEIEKIFKSKKKEYSNEIQQLTRKQQEQIKIAQKSHFLNKLKTRLDLWDEISRIKSGQSAHSIYKLYPHLIQDSSKTSYYSPLENLLDLFDTPIKTVMVSSISEIDGDFDSILNNMRNKARQSSIGKSYAEKIKLRSTKDVYDIFRESTGKINHIIRNSGLGSIHREAEGNRDSKYLKGYFDSNYIVEIFHHKNNQQQQSLSKFISNNSINGIHIEDMLSIIKQIFWGMYKVQNMFGLTNGFLTPNLIKLEYSTYKFAAGIRAVDDTYSNYTAIRDTIEFKGNKGNGRSNKFCKIPIILTSGQKIDGILATQKLEFRMSNSDENEEYTVSDNDVPMRDINDNNNKNNDITIEDMDDENTTNSNKSDIIVEDIDNEMSEYINIQSQNNNNDDDIIIKNMNVPQIYDVINKYKFRENADDVFYASPQELEIILIGQRYKYSSMSDDIWTTGVTLLSMLATNLKRNAEEFRAFNIEDNVWPSNGGIDCSKVPFFRLYHKYNGFTPDTQSSKKINIQREIYRKLLDYIKEGITIENMKNSININDDLERKIFTNAIEAYLGIILFTRDKGQGVPYFATISEYDLEQVHDVYIHLNSGEDVNPWIDTKSRITLMKAIFLNNYGNNNKSLFEKMYETTKPQHNSMVKSHLYDILRTKFITLEHNDYRDIYQNIILYMISPDEKERISANKEISTQEHLRDILFKIYYINIITQQGNISQTTNSFIDEYKFRELLIEKSWKSQYGGNYIQNDFIPIINDYNSNDIGYTKDFGEYISLVLGKKDTNIPSFTDRKKIIRYDDLVKAFEEEKNKSKNKSTKLPPPSSKEQKNNNKDTNDAIKDNKNKVVINKRQKVFTKNNNETFNQKMLRYFIYAVKFSTGIGTLEQAATVVKDSVSNMNKKNSSDTTTKNPLPANDNDSKKPNYNLKREQKEIKDDYKPPTKKRKQNDSKHKDIKPIQKKRKIIIKKKEKKEEEKEKKNKTPIADDI